MTHWGSPASHLHDYGPCNIGVLVPKSVFLLQDTVMIRMNSKLLLLVTLWTLCLESRKSSSWQGQWSSFTIRWTIRLLWCSEGKKGYLYNPIYLGVSSHGLLHYGHEHIPTATLTDQQLRCPWASLGHIIRKATKTSPCASWMKKPGVRVEERYDGSSCSFKFNRSHTAVVLPIVLPSSMFPTPTSTREEDQWTMEGPV